MGDLADWLAYGDLLSDEWDDYPNTYLSPSLYSNIPRGYWRTREGKMLKIDAMGTSHLSNTIKMLERNGRDHTAKYRELQTEWKGRYARNQQQQPCFDF